MAPQVGLEPTTLRLTAECSAIELLRNTVAHGHQLSRARTTFIAKQFQHRKARSRSRYMRASIALCVQMITKLKLTTFLTAC